MKKLLFSLLSLVVATSALGQINFSNGLLAYYPFNGNANDASGNGNNGFVSGAIPVSDQWGTSNSAYYFNGLNSYIIVPHNATLSPTGQFSICAKVKMQGFYNGLCYNNAIIVKGFDRTTGSYSLRTTTDSLDCNTQDTMRHVYRCDVQTISTNNAQAYQPYVSLNNWDCLIGTYENDTVKLYVNGVFRYKYYEPAMGVNTDDLYIGMLNSPVYPDWFNGVIDEVRLYNRALNSEEIAAYCTVDKPVTGIIETTGNFSFSLSPNPVKDKLRIQFFVEKGSEPLSLIIQDVSGRTVMQEKIQIVSGNNYYLLDASKLPAGLYFINLKSEYSTIVKKFIRE